MTRTLVLWSLSCYEHPHVAGGMVARSARAASSHRRWRGPPEVRQFEARKSPSAKRALFAKKAKRAEPPPTRSEQQE